MVARHFGSKNYNRLKTAVTTSLIASAAIGLALTRSGLDRRGLLIETDPDADGDLRGFLGISVDLSGRLSVSFDLQHRDGDFLSAG